jgi:hypothetical protein
MKHAFLADMGYFHLQGPDYASRSFPIDSRQMLYLIEKGHIENPNINSDDIDDRNKMNSLARSDSLRISTHDTRN